MKILAVIPARAGSKGIPNKNIRIVGEHPLVYYTINNAKKSKYITDIIVSTDSYEVSNIAKHMDVKVKDRDKNLCGDNITLDSVIFDAIPKDDSFDYIVTLQPTSPTLKVDTLDNAIKYAIENDIDTLISAINAPHLSWRKEKGEFFPNYKERLNRQYLPSNYLETGAFIISKRNVISPNTRIGNKVEVFEISEDEAIDIDNFNDLYLVSHLLSQKKVAIYVNGNNSRGTGHIYRALELADEFYVKPDIYYDINQTDKKIFGPTTHNLIAINGENELFEHCKKNNYNLFINDILDTSKEFIKGLSLSMPYAKIVNFEDIGEGASDVDAVINALYEYHNIINDYFGSKYFICKKTFLMYDPIKINREVKDVFICFGGADPMCYTDRILKIVQKDSFKNVNFHIAVGKAKTNVNELIKFNTDNITVEYDIKDMPEFMSKCDIAITSRGRTAYELAILGIPTIAMAQNEQEEKHDFVSNENGYMYIGLNPTDEVIEKTLLLYISLSRESRERYQRLLLSHDLKNGRSNVMNIINKL